MFSYICAPAILPDCVYIRTHTHMHVHMHTNKNTHAHADAHARARAREGLHSAYTVGGRGTFATLRSCAKMDPVVHGKVGT